MTVTHELASRKYELLQVGRKNSNKEMETIGQVFLKGSAVAPLAWIPWVPGNPSILRSGFWNTSIFRNNMYFNLQNNRAGWKIPHY